MSDDARVKAWEPREGLATARVALGRPLRVARELAGLSQRAAAEAGGVSQAGLSRAEQGAGELEPGALEKLAEAYGCKSSELRPRNSMPSAPLEPSARLEWVRARNAAFARGDVRFSSSGTEGKGVLVQG